MKKNTLPSKGQQICETCRHAGHTCALKHGRCVCGMWTPIKRR